MSHNANPAQYGWTYQGSNQASKVEFYEKDGVKMDYYYTTGEIDVMCISAGALRNRITAQHAQHGGQLTDEPSTTNRDADALHASNRLLFCHRCNDDLWKSELWHHHCLGWLQAGTPLAVSALLMAAALLHQLVQLRCPLYGPIPATQRSSAVV